MSTSHVPAVRTAGAALEEHCKRHRGGELLRVGSAAGEEFSRLYTIWICARWDTGDAWVRSIWTTRPTEGA